MPRAKKKPSIEQQLRTLIATATEERMYGLAQKLIDILSGLGQPQTGQEKEVEEHEKA